MNVLFVTENCGDAGGVEVAVAQAATALGERGHRCALAYGRRTPHLNAAFEHAFTRRDAVRELGGTTASLSEVVADFRPDTLFIHKVPSIAFCLPYVDSTRVVRMVHDHDVTCPRRHKYHALSGRICTHRADWRCAFDGATWQRTERGLEWRSLPEFFAERQRHRRLHAMLVGSRAMRQELLDNGFAEHQVHCLPPVVQWAPRDPAPPAADPHVLYVGQLVRGKGVDLLLSALSRVRGDWRATIVGDGNARPLLQTAAERLGLSDRVTFHGWIPHADLDRYYEAARLVVVPSRWPEPFGLVGLEAMRHGRPVVAFDVGGIPDWLQHGITGFLAPEHNVERLAWGIQVLLQNTRLATVLGRQGYDRLVDEFSFDRYIDRLETWLEAKRPCTSA